LHVNLFDLRKPSAPQISFKQKTVVRCVGFLNKGKQVISSSLEGDIMVHDIVSGDALIHEKILGSKEEIEGNTCYSFRVLKDGLTFLSTHEDFVT